jgi:hypothetical protein
MNAIKIRHQWAPLPGSHRLFLADEERFMCEHCPCVRAPRFGGGVVFSPGGLGRSDWTQRMPSCDAAKEGA